MELGAASHCCAGYSIIGAMFTVSRDRGEKTVTLLFG